MSRVFSGMEALLGMLGSVVLQIKYNKLTILRYILKKNMIDNLLLIFFEQVAQVLLTLPYSFSQLGMVSGIVLQVFYGLIGSWTAYLISVLYIEYRSRKEKEGASFKNHVIQVRIIFKNKTIDSIYNRIVESRAYEFSF